MTGRKKSGKPLSLYDNIWSKQPPATLTALVIWVSRWRRKQPYCYQYLAEVPRAISEKVKSLNASNAPTQKARLSHDDVMNSRDDEQKVTRRRKKFTIARRKHQESNYNCEFIDLTQEFTANKALIFVKTRFSGLKTIWPFFYLLTYYWLKR